MLNLDPRRLSGIAGAFSQPSSGGFWSGLTAGLGGSFAGLAKYDIQTHEAERDQLRQMMEERRFALDQSRYDLEQRRVTAEETRANTAAQKAEPDWNVTVQGPDGEPVTGLPPYLQGVPPAARSAASQQFYEKMYATPAKDEFAPNLDPETKRMLALNLASGNGLISLGRGTAGARFNASIATQAAHDFPNLNIAANKANYDATRKSLSVLTQNKASVEAFSKTALKNADMLEKSLDSIPDTGTMWGNQAGRYFATHLGSDAMSKYRAALETVTPELTRILSTATAGGVAITNSQKADVQAALSPNYTKKQMQSALALFRAELANRGSSYDEEIRMIEGRLQQAPGQTSGDRVWVRDPSTGRLVPQ